MQSHRDSFISFFSSGVCGLPFEILANLIVTRRYNHFHGYLRVIRTKIRVGMSLKFTSAKYENYDYQTTRVRRLKCYVPVRVEGRYWGDESRINTGSTVVILVRRVSPTRGRDTIISLFIVFTRHFVYLTTSKCI